MSLRLYASPVFGALVLRMLRQAYEVGLSDKTVDKKYSFLPRFTLSR